MFVLLDASTSVAVGTGTPAQSGLSSWLFWVMLIVVVVAFYFFIIRPRKKQEKEQSNMKNSLRVGDDITTIGGIVGRVVKVKDDTFTIITSRDKTRMSFARFALRSIDFRAGEAYDPKKEAANVKADKAEKTEKTDDKPSENSENK